MTKKTFQLYLLYADALRSCEEGSDQFHEAIDGFKSLPGYPMESDGDDGILWQPKIIGEPTVSVLN